MVCSTNICITGGSGFLKLCLVENKDYMKLFRKYVSRQAAGKGKTLLAALRLPPESIAAFYAQLDKSEIEAVQAGLIAWQGRASEPTWAVLLKAMKVAGIAVEHRDDLKEELTGEQQ